MDPSASKRRKISPTESVPVESTTPPGPPPPQQDKQSEPQPSLSQSPQSPSLASPTKSSLARHNPEVLDRGRDTASRRFDDLPASRPTSRDDNTESEPAITASNQQRHSAERDASIPTLSATATALSSVAQDAPRSPVRRVGGSTLGAQLPRHTPTRPQPRPLPPPDPSGQDEEIANPFMGRALRRSPTNTGVVPQATHEEPILPPTPQHPDPVVSTPPSGIHNTPSKRRRDERERESSQRASSPLKKPPSQQAQPQKPQKQVHKIGVLQGAKRKSPVQTTEETTAPSPKPVPEEEQSRVGVAPKAHPRRSVRLRGPDWKQMQKRDALLQEISQLEADLELARGEHIRTDKGLPSNNDPDVLLALFRRRLLPPAKESEPDPSARWVEAAMDPFAMLGFNGQPSTQFPPILPQSGTEQDSQTSILSHHPIVMTAYEELPYLQVFTPLTFTTHMSTLAPRSEQLNQSPQQKYDIDIRSASPPGLFTTRMEMIVTTRNQAVASLAVPQLDPAAASELRPFIDKIISTTALYHPALTHNVSILCFAMGEWYRIALKRAKFWHALETEFGPANKDGFAAAVAAMRMRKRRNKRRAPEASGSDSGVAESLDEADSFASLDGMMISKKELLPHMGRTSMDFEVPCLSGGRNAESSEVRVSWGVQFDWAGVAKSKLDVEVGVPSKWRAADKRKSILGIPKLFTKLLHGGEDPLTAVKTVMALMAGEPAS